MTTFLNELVFKETDDIEFMDKTYFGIGFLNSKLYPIISKVVRHGNIQYYLFGFLKIWECS